jgi:uncharacterized protein YacL (UPF0231 family)
MLRFHHDAAGDPRAHAGEDRKLLAHWLESDVQGSAALARKILAALEKLEAGELDSWEGTGNAFTLILTEKGAAIEPALESTADPLHLSLPELREALERWVEFVG